MLCSMAFAAWTITIAPFVCLRTCQSFSSDKFILASINFRRLLDEHAYFEFGPSWTNINICKSYSIFNDKNWIHIMRYQTICPMRPDLCDGFEQTKLRSDIILVWRLCRHTIRTCHSQPIPAWHEIPGKTKYFTDHIRCGALKPRLPRHSLSINVCIWGTWWASYFDQNRSKYSNALLISNKWPAAASEWKPLCNQVICQLSH